MIFYPHSCGNRLELFAIYAYLFSAFGLNQVTWVIMIWMSFYTKYGLYFVLGYFVWIYLDRDTCKTGGRRSNWFRSCAWWKYMRSYFPAHLHKTADLPPDRNYLLTVFPHCVLSAGAYTAFGTDCNNFQTLFPGLVSYLVTLRILFFLPVVRELMIMSGLISPAEESINWVLGSPGVGRACVLVAGGSAEAVHSEPGVYKTILPRRRGFCRIALQNGADLVPVVVFGEVDVYELQNPKPGSLLERMQLIVKDITGVMPVRFFGEGLFGLVPKPVPINVVVGAPISVERREHPTNEEINALHELFTSSLIDLFNNEKHKYLEDKSLELDSLSMYLNFHLPTLLENLNS